MRNLKLSHMVWGVFLICLLIGMDVSAEELPGIPVFGDDFSVSGLFVENWIPSKGVRIENGRAIIPANNNMKLRRVPEVQ